MGQAWSHVAPLPGVTDSCRQRQVNSQSWIPFHICLFAAAGWKTVILLTALTTAKPPGQKSHLEKWTESSAHRLRIPQTTSPWLQSSFCKRKREEESGCDKAHLEPGVTKIILKTELTFFYLLLSLSEAESTANRQPPCKNTRFIFMLQHFFVCLCVFSSDVIKELLETASHQPHVLKPGGEEEQKETGAWRQPVGFVYLFSSDTNLNNLNLNKVIEDLWGAGISPTKSLAFLLFLS